MTAYPILQVYVVVSRYATNCQDAQFQFLFLKLGIHRYSEHEEREKVRGGHIYLSAGDGIRGNLQAWTWHRLAPAQVPRVTFWQLLMVNEADIYRARSKGGAHVYSKHPRHSFLPFRLKSGIGGGKYGGIRTVEAVRRGNYMSHYTLPSHFDYS